MRSAMLPIPTRPMVLPVNSMPVISGGAIRPKPSWRLLASQNAMPLHTLSIRPIISSATELVLAFGVLITGILYSLAASKSMVLHPTPCFTITFRLLACDMISRVMLAVRSMMASISLMRSNVSVISPCCFSSLTASGWIYSLRYTSMFVPPYKNELYTTYKTIKCCAHFNRYKQYI